eukprot:5693812-Pleurochrysis_carterae.AAC.1
MRNEARPAAFICRSAAMRSQCSAARRIGVFFNLYAPSRRTFLSITANWPTSALCLLALPLLCNRVIALSFLSISSSVDQHLHLHRRDVVVGGGRLKVGAHTLHGLCRTSRQADTG